MKPSVTESAVVNEAMSSQAMASLSMALLPANSSGNIQSENQTFDLETEAVRLCEVGKLMLTANRFQEALDQFEQALEADPHYVDSWYHRADALACLNRYEEALDSLEQAQELAGFETSYIWVQKAVVLILLNRAEAALNCCNYALRLEPNYFQAWLFRGVALHCLGNYREAYHSYYKASGQPKSTLHQNLRRFYHDISTYGQAS
jgi:tetratricopeptide (TPR) repeat protein